MKRLMYASFSLLVVLTISAPNAICGGGKDPKKDPEEIGNRDVGKGVNFYSIEKEIAIGKSLAQDVERQAKLINDPIIAEYANRLGQNLVRNSGANVRFAGGVGDSEDATAF